MPRRIPIPKKTRDELLVKCKHSCCMCEEFGVEIHHMDGDPSNNQEDNLIPLCSRCAGRAHVDFPPASRTNGISPDQLRIYKENWIARCNSKVPVVAEDINEIKLRLTQLIGEVRKLQTDRRD